jgi:hypothetical protein
MALPEREPDNVDEALQAERSGLALKTVGWVLLAMDFILLSFVWVSLRSGSKFWLIWVLAEAFLGLLLIRIGITKRARAARRVRRPAA